VGAQAPSLRLADLVGPSCPVAAHEGEPIVIAFVPGNVAFATQSAATLDAVRAELRGLGAALVLFADDGVWHVRADDPPTSYASNADFDRARLAAFRASYGADDRSLWLFVIDGGGTLRQIHSVQVAGEEAVRLLGLALEKAGHAVAQAPAPFVVSRRDLVLTSLLGAMALVFAETACTPRRAPDPGASPVDNPEQDVVLDINGVTHTLRIEPRVTLLDALRERLGLPGTKKGCDHGQCGACTVLIDDRRVNACLTLAVMAQGTRITTIEGLAQGDDLHPLQAAFASEDGFQCGYCTPGQIMSAAGLLKEGHAKTDQEVREQMSGNICRCGAYPNIVSAIQLARPRVGA
jgi:xanthine dehydrogenase YagT iron-sulfur-binding subunit